MCSNWQKNANNVQTEEHRRIYDGRGGDGRWTMLLVCFVRTKQIEMKSFYFILATSDTFFVGAGWRKRFHFVFVNSRRFNLKRKQQHWTWPDHRNALKRSGDLQGNSKYPFRCWIEMNRLISNGFSFSWRISVNHFHLRNFFSHFWRKLKHHQFICNT